MEVLWVSVKHDPANWDQRIVTLWPHLCDIVYIKSVLISISNWHNLNLPVPGGSASVQESLMQVSSCEVLVLLTLLGSLLIGEAFDALGRLEMVLNQVSFTLCVNPLESV